MTFHGCDLLENPSCREGFTNTRLHSIITQRKSDRLIARGFSSENTAPCFRINELALLRTRHTNHANHIRINQIRGEETLFNGNLFRDVHQSYR